jgi:site-specific DNA-methyltransferase (adenine-specific)
MIWNGFELPPAYYSDDAVYIINADCRDVLPLIPDKSIDLVLTDPPYGIGEAHGRNKSRGKIAVSKDYGIAVWDDKPIDQVVINQIIFKAENSIIFGGNYYCLPPSPCWLVWDKDNGTNDFADCELAWTNFTSAVRKYLWRWNGMLQQAGCPKEIRYHPTQKPVGLFKAILSDYSKPSDMIFDPFLGSGTTAVAAKILGRKCIGIEISEKYCEIAALRCLRESK